MRSRGRLPTAADDLAGYVRGVRARLSLTQAQLAAALGVSLLTVNRWENGHKQPSPTTFRRLAELDSTETTRLADVAQVVRLPVTPRLALVARSASVPTNLPHPTTSFIGRSIEISQVRRYLRSTPLVTLTGSGGSGKSRLALHVGRPSIADFPDGVYWVDLALVQSPDDVDRTIAVALGCTESPHRLTLDQIAATLADKRLLLILDNCEQVVQGCATVVERLLSRCPRLRILATSRERLAVPGEVNVRLDPLPLPDRHQSRSVETILASDAVRLFVERVRAVAPHFGLDAHSAAVAAAICEQLDGLPLAIELAATRVDALSLAEIAERLDRPFDLLRVRRRAGDSRHQSLREVGDWSYRLLDPAEQAVYCALSVFSGSFTLSAAEAVCGGVLGARCWVLGDEGTRTQHLAPSTPLVLDLLQSLVEKSMLRAETAGRQTRYSLLETLRHYGADRLAEWADASTLRQAHAQYYLGVAEAAFGEIFGSEQGHWLDVLEAEHANLRTALQFFESVGDRDSLCLLAGVLYRFWVIRGHLPIAREWFRRALAGPSSPRSRVRALRGGSVIARELCEATAAIEFAREQLVLSRSLGDDSGIAWAIANLASLERITGRVLVTAEDVDEAERRFERCGDAAGAVWLLAYRAAGVDLPLRYEPLERVLAAFRWAGDSFGVVWGCLRLAETLLDLGDLSSALLRLREGMGLSQELHAVYLQAFALDLVDRAASSEKPGRRSLDLRLQSGDRLGLAFSLVAIAADEVRIGRPARAACLLGALWRHFLDNLAREDGLDVWLASDEGLGFTPVRETVQSALGRPHFQVAWDKGTAMSLEAAIHYAVASGASALEAAEDADKQWLSDALVARGDELARLGGPVATVGMPPKLTAREEDVVRLVVLGRTNREIGQELTLSVRTVERHLENIYAKTRVRGRSGLASYTLGLT